MFPIVFRVRGSDLPLRVRSFVAVATVACLAGAPMREVRPQAAIVQPPSRPDSLAKSDSTAQSLRAILVRDSRRSRLSYALPRTLSAVKTETRARDVPQSVSVVTAALIADQAMQSMADVVRYVPGVTMGLGEGHRDAPTIRGNSTTADFYVDGVRDDAQYLRDVYNVERVEALKGSNAMTFGRGGGGGVLNRVTKEAHWSSARRIAFEGGSFDHKRASFDVGQALSSTVAARLNAVTDHSAGFRIANRYVRSALNPTVAFLVAPRTIARIGYEYLHDDRTVDRGVPSYQGRPAAVDPTTFFGNPLVNRSTMQVHSTSATLEHTTRSGLKVRNRTRIADYNKFYRNSFAGAVAAGGQTVALAAYDHRIGRRNLFNQTDVTLGARTGKLQHTLLAGAELGSQDTEQFRNTGYFNNSTTSILVPMAAPLVSTPVTFRQSAADADNRTVANVAAVYVQDQLEVNEQLQFVGGLRLEQFGVRFHNARNNQRLMRTDRVLSPRAGIVIKPRESMSVYGSLARTWLPSSGDQFGALTVNTTALSPERFTNREVGIKWDVATSLSLTAAHYRLDRTNTTAPDPLDATRVVQTGAQRTTGVEVGATGDVTSAWQIAGGVAIQRARIISTTSSAKTGASVPLVPHTTASLWNRHRLTRRLSAGVGVVHQGRTYAAIDNSVALPAFTRVDGALFASAVAGLQAQINVENLFDRRYIATSHGNNNIMPGASRTVRVSLSVSR